MHLYNDLLSNTLSLTEGLLLLTSHKSVWELSLVLTLALEVPCLRPEVHLTFLFIIKYISHQHGCRPIHLCTLGGLLEGLDCVPGLQI